MKEDIDGNPLYTEQCPMCGRWVYDLIPTNVEDGCGHKMRMCVRCANGQGWFRWGRRNARSS